MSKMRDSADWSHSSVTRSASVHSVAVGRVIWTRNQCCVQLGPTSSPLWNGRNRCLIASEKGTRTCGAPEGQYPILMFSALSVRATVRMEVMEGYADERNWESRLRVSARKCSGLGPAECTA